MCGIAGIISVDTQEITKERIKKMTDVIAHRGPDGEGHWISDNRKVGFGHRRLSIIDLSHEADQPMHYAGRYTIVFNGEIYNYIELKEQLVMQGYTFNTTSDTEVLMALYDRDKENCLKLLDGMFSFAILDQQEQSVFCARDRFGEKPFFFAFEKGKYFVFGSEMKELWAAGIEKKINNRMLYNYLLQNSLEDPEDLSETFYQHCTRLPHSHYLKISLADLSINIHKYYDLDWRVQNNSITQEEASAQFRQLFYTSIQRRLRSDVAVGSSLSGGLDSSLVVTVIDELLKGTAQIQKTFSAIFPGFERDESHYMKMVIEKTNVQPHFVIPDDQGMIANLDKLFFHQEEPFGSASIYVQYRIMELAKENHVTVLLDGQGADEILAGYHRYYSAYFNELSGQNKNKLKEEIEFYKSLHESNDINGIQQRGLVQRLQESIPFAVGPLKKIYRVFNPIKASEIFNPDFRAEFGKNIYKSIPTPRSLNEMLYNSTFKSGLQELLRYADRNSMAHGREVRLPFLSHELVEFIFSLPSHFKIKQGWTKWIMRQSFQWELPQQIAWRKDKIGYEPPQKDWMNHPAFIEKIGQANTSLINNKIINTKSKVQTNQNAADANNWKQCMVAGLLDN